MSERIELWATVRNGCVHAYYRDPDLAARMRHPDEQIVHLVELREGEPHPDKVDVTIEDMRDQRDAAIERAEKAEAEAKQLCRDFYAKRMDERARFERECAMHLFAENNIREDYDIKDCFSDARELADHYFGAKEAKG